jgi:DNA repair exonuclease SbcCD ATPase subunit
MEKKLRKISSAKAGTELMALRERETELNALVEDARREHNAAVGNRHLAVGFDDAAVAGIDEQIIALREKFDELNERLVNATAEREAAQQRYAQLMDQAGRVSYATNLEQRIGAIQKAVASFHVVSQELAKKLASSTDGGARLTGSVFRTADVLEQEVYGIIGDLETARTELLSGARSLPNLDLSEPAAPLVPANVDRERVD